MGYSMGLYSSIWPRKFTTQSGRQVKGRVLAGTSRGVLSCSQCIPIWLWVLFSYRNSAHSPGWAQLSQPHPLPGPPPATPRSEGLPQLGRLQRHIMALSPSRDQTNSIFPAFPALPLLCFSLHYSVR